MKTPDQIAQAILEKFNLEGGPGYLRGIAFAAAEMAYAEALGNAKDSSPGKEKRKLLSLSSTSDYHELSRIRYEAMHGTRQEE